MFREQYAKSQFYCIIENNGIKKTSCIARVFYELVMCPALGEPVGGPVRASARETAQSGLDLEHVSWLGSVAKSPSSEGEPGIAAGVGACELEERTGVNHSFNIY